MMCPRCRFPMHLGRYYPGECKVFRCNYCSRRISRREAERTGYEGYVVLNSRIPVRHQESEGSL